MSKMNKRLLLSQCENVISAISVILENDELTPEANQLIKGLKRDVKEFFKEVKKLRKKVKDRESK